MVDHIHFPKSVAPLFPTEKIKKVRRRKDQQQDAGFKDNLEKEKKDGEDQDEDDNYEPSPERKKAAAVKSKKWAASPGRSAKEKKKPLTNDAESEKRIDIHA